MSPEEVLSLLLSRVKSIRDTTSLLCQKLENIGRGTELFSTSLSYEEQHPPHDLFSDNHDPLLTIVQILATEPWNDLQDLSDQIVEFSISKVGKENVFYLMEQVLNTRAAIAELYRRVVTCHLSVDPLAKLSGFLSQSDDILIRIETILNRKKPDLMHPDEEDHSHDSNVHVTVSTEHEETENAVKVFKYLETLRYFYNVFKISEMKNMKRNVVLFLQKVDMVLKRKEALCSIDSINCLLLKVSELESLRDVVATLSHQLDEFSEKEKDSENHWSEILSNINGLISHEEDGFLELSRAGSTPPFRRRARELERIDEIQVQHVSWNSEVALDRPERPMDVETVSDEQDAAALVDLPYDDHNYFNVVEKRSKETGSDWDGDEDGASEDSIRGESTEAETCLQCGLCGRILGSRDALKKHALCHSEERPFPCETCGKAFARSDSLRKHMRAHTGEKPFQCGICFKSFARNELLRTHYRIHTGEKPFQCDVCGKSFTAKGSFYVHYRIHSQQKPFHCDVCGRSFSQKEILNKHSRTHTGEKPFQCDQCGRAFARKDYLDAHYRTHTGEKPYQCGVCGRTFTQKGDCNKHLRTHSGEKPFRCDVCGRAFASNTSLHTHYRNHLEEEDVHSTLGVESVVETEGQHQLV